MICPRCGFNNYDGVLECCNCHNRLPQISSYQQQMQQPIMPNFNSNKSLIDEDLLKEPKKKRNFKPFFIALFIIGLVTATGFCFWAYQASQEKIQKDKEILDSIPLIQEQPISTPKVSDKEIVSITDNAQIETPAPEENINKEEQDVNQENDVVKIETELFKIDGYSIYGDKTIAQLKVSAINEASTLEIYDLPALKFWNNTKIGITSKTYDSSNILKSMYDNDIEPYIDLWSFPEKKDDLKPLDFNGYYGYYVDGYNEVSKLYTRVYFITSVKAIYDNDGMVTKENSPEKVGEYVMVIVTYPQEDAKNTMKLLKTIPFSSTTKFNDLSLEELEKSMQETNENQPTEDTTEESVE